jgi:hypothetical protein
MQKNVKCHPERSEGSAVRGSIMLDAFDSPHLLHQLMNILAGQ